MLFLIFLFTIVSWFIQTQVTKIFLSNQVRKLDHSAESFFVFSDSSWWVEAWILNLLAHNIQMVESKGGGGSLTRMLLQVLVLIVDRGPGLNPYRSLLAEKRGHKGK